MFESITSTISDRLWSSGFKTTSEQLQAAIKSNNSALITVLLKEDPSLTNAILPNGYTPLAYAFRQNRDDSIETLIKHGADASENLVDNLNSFDLALYRKNKKNLEAIYGAELADKVFHTTNLLQGTTKTNAAPISIGPFKNLVFAKHAELLATFDKIVISYNNLDATTFVNTFSGAIINNEAASINRYVANSSLKDLKKRDLNGLSPIHYAVLYKNNALVNQLIQKHPELASHLTGKSENLYHLAVLSKNEDLIPLLKQHKVSLSHETLDDLTPLHYASLLSEIKIFNLLVSQGAIVDPKKAKVLSPIAILVSSSISKTNHLATSPLELSLLALNLFEIGLEIPFLDDLKVWSYYNYKMKNIEIPYSLKTMRYLSSMKDAVSGVNYLIHSLYNASNIVTSKDSKALNAACTSLLFSVAFFNIPPIIKGVLGSVLVANNLFASAKIASRYFAFKPRASIFKFLTSVVNNGMAIKNIFFNNYWTLDRKKDTDPSSDIPSAKEKFKRTFYDIPNELFKGPTHMSNPKYKAFDLFPTLSGYLNSGIADIDQLIIGALSSTHLGDLFRHGKPIYQNNRKFASYEIQRSLKSLQEAIESVDPQFDATKIVKLEGYTTDFSPLLKIKDEDIETFIEKLEVIKNKVEDGSFRKEFGDYEYLFDHKTYESWDTSYYGPWKTRDSKIKNNLNDLLSSLKYYRTFIRNFKDYCNNYIPPKSPPPPEPEEPFTGFPDPDDKKYNEGVNLLKCGHQNPYPDKGNPYFDNKFVNFISCAYPSATSWSGQFKPESARLVSKYITKNLRYIFFDKLQHTLKYSGTTLKVAQDASRDVSDWNGYIKNTYKDEIKKRKK